MKKNELKKIFKSAITSKILLYTLSFISFANLLYFLNENYLGGIVIFLFVGLLSHHYTNNMIIILFLSIIVSNLLVIVANVCNKNSKKEGMNNGTTDSSTINDPPPASPPPVSPPPDPSNNTTLSDSKSSTQTIAYSSIPAHSAQGVGENRRIKQSGEEEADSGEEDSDNEGSTETVTTPSAATETSEGLTNLSDRHRKNFSAIKRTNDTSLENAQMLRDVQGQLETLIGGNGIQNLDTTELLKQQKELMLAIKQMQPLIDGATGMMDKISGSGIGSLFGMNKKNNEK